MAERAGAEPRYKAFLSYSHKDAAEAARIHRRLEGYRLPRRLAGRETERGRVPQRLWPIFRDREEMAAATDLSETVRAALAESAALIVLCSPDAAESLWVSEEIATFRRLHPDRPVLAAILAGEPPTCFPPALRLQDPDGTWHEPLATDLRRQGDGPHLGLLKLVAGITGVPLDDLVQRDASRRIRRVTAVTAGALVAALIMAALTVVALGARREADRQRAEAEGLIEFMLTDLRERLRGVGQLDVLTAVNQRALAHYGQQQDLSGLPADALLRRARILHSMAEDDVARGHLDAALAASREAQRTTAEQLARAPDDPARIFAHAQSEYWIGHVHELRQDWPVAERQYRHYARAAERLIALAPANADYMMEAGWGAQNLGAVRLRGFNDPLTAESLFRAAARWFEAAAAARTDNRAILREQANVLGWLADSYYERQLWQPSFDARMRQYRITERLHRGDPENVELVYRLTIAERSVARLSGRLGDQRQAGRLLTRAYERSRQLTARDPHNAEWLLLRTKIECDLLNHPSTIAQRPLANAMHASIRSAGARLAAQNNPRITEIRRCLGNVNSQEADMGDGR